MVDDHIFNDARTLVAECPDHLLQLGLCAPAGIMVEPEAGVIAHRLTLAMMIFGSFTTLRNPDEVEVL